MDASSYAGGPSLPRGQWGFFSALIPLYDCGSCRVSSGHIPSSPVTSRHVQSHRILSHQIASRHSRNPPPDVNPLIWGQRVVPERYVPRGSSEKRGSRAGSLISARQITFGVVQRACDEIVVCSDKYPVVFGDRIHDAAQAYDKRGSHLPADLERVVLLQNIGQDRIGMIHAEILLGAQKKGSRASFPNWQPPICRLSASFADSFGRTASGPSIRSWLRGLPDAVNAAENPQARQVVRRYRRVRLAAALSPIRAGVSNHDNTACHLRELLLSSHASTKRARAALEAPGGLIHTSTRRWPCLPEHVPCRRILADSVRFPGIRPQSVCGLSHAGQRAREGL